MGILDIARIGFKAKPNLGCLAGSFVCTVGYQFSNYSKKSIVSAKTSISKRPVFDEKDRKENDDEIYFTWTKLFKYLKNY